MKTMWNCAKSMPAIGVLTASCLVSAASASSAAEAGNWTTHSYPNDGFSITLPADPQIQTRQGITDPSSQIRAFTVDLGQGVFAVTMIQIGSNGWGKELEAVLQDGRNAILVTSKTHLVSEKKIALNGAPGLEIESANDTMHFSSRCYVAGNRTYLVVEGYPIGKPFDHGLEFLDSFRLIGGESVASPAAQLGNWTIHSFPADGFSISLPADPQIQTEPGRPGSSIQLRLFIVDLGQDQLIVGAVQLTAAAASKDPESILQAAKNNGIAKSKTRLVSEKKITLNGEPGLEIEVENETDHTRSRLYVVGPVLYIVTASYPIGKPFDHSSEFLDSFRLIAGEPAGSAK